MIVKVRMLSGEDPYVAVTSVEELRQLDCTLPITSNGGVGYKCITISNDVMLSSLP